MSGFPYLLLFVFVSVTVSELVDEFTQFVDPGNTVIWGGGLTPDRINLPARYFYIHTVDTENERFRRSPGRNIFTVSFHSKTSPCRANVDLIDRKDGSFIVRYKIIEICQNVELHVKYFGQHVALSPYGPFREIQPDRCNCPVPMKAWLSNFECPTSEQQIKNDLNPFRQVNASTTRAKILEKYNMPSSVSLCNYVVQGNRIYRKCHGQYTGFKMFSDAILLSLARKVQLPNFEIFVNLGDWPLSKKGGQSRTTGPLPIFSWCGSDDSFDIVMPTYDITESTLENMGRVTLDMLSVQRVRVPWREKKPLAFWRGRDSRRERLHIIDLARNHSELINASLTNFFFFRDEEEQYGPKVPHISFLDFFDYKYQINIDGTVAAYRFPYLLAGNSLVLKQESQFYEYFYKKLEPYVHYVPFKRDLSNLIEQIEWARENEDKVLEIISNANAFVRHHLLPTDILCYHATLFNEWSKVIIGESSIDGMELVEQPVDSACDCKTLLDNNETRQFKDEL